MMTPKQARVIDPVLSGIAQGYTHPQRVGSILFPRVEVVARGGNVLEFGRESFRLMATRRSPGGPTLNVMFGYTGKPFALVQDALNMPIPRELLEDAQAVPGIDLGKRATNAAMQNLTLTLEAEQAEIATNPQNYSDDRKLSLAGTEKWDDPESDPVKAVADAKENVRKQAGVDPNRMVLSKRGFNALTTHPKIVERFKFTSSTSITADMLARILDLDMIGVGRAVALEEGPLESAKFEDVWKNDAVLAYVPAASSGLEEPSFGYTYTLKGHPFVEKPEWDGNLKSWVYGVTFERIPVLTGIAAGFLFQNVTTE